ncbi:MAG: exosome complex exonuclease Rrp41 [Methanobacteriota archaeon]|nr:MAG: exosome complex exonuclease Rrp41 [Euryarchaeota archaeon]
MKMSEEIFRPDGRKANEMRNLEIQVGVLEQADGSARVVLGKNIVLAAVNGPRELHPKHLAMSQKALVRVTYKMLPFSVEHRKHPVPSRREKEISKVLSEAFESVVLTHLFPRSAIDVQVQMIQADGGSRTAAAIATSAALADAGIPMRGLIGGIASGLFEDKCVLDLSGYEDNVGTGDCPILYAPTLDEVSLLQLDGKFTPEQFKECFQMSLNAIKEIEKKQKEALIEKYVKIRQEILSDEVEEDEETDVDSVSDISEAIPHTERETVVASSIDEEEPLDLETSDISEVTAETVQAPEPASPLSTSEEPVEEEEISPAMAKPISEPEPKDEGIEASAGITEPEIGAESTPSPAPFEPPEITPPQIPKTEEPKIEEEPLKPVSEVIYEKNKELEQKDEKPPVRRGFFSSRMAELLKQQKTTTTSTQDDESLEVTTVEEEENNDEKEEGKKDPSEIERDLEFLDYLDE